jgi:protein TonB
MVLQSSLLDLLFENRNKAYGAYVLRKFYGMRLKKALFGTVLFSVSLFLLFSSFKSKNNVKKNPNIKTPLELTVPVVQKKTEENQVTRKEPVKGEKIQKQRPLMIPQFVDNPPELPKLPDLPPGNFNGNTDLPQSGGNGTIPGIPGHPDSTGIQKKKPEEIKIPAPEINKVYDNYEVDPAYPGGKAALGSYLQSKLGDEAIEDGIVKKITVNFIIETDGTVTNIKTENNADADFIRKTVKAFEKMKKWNPGKIKGAAVRVYYSIPVSILPGED